MSMESFPIGQEMDVTYPNFKVSLTLLSGTQLTFEITEGPFARTETVDIQVVPLPAPRSSSRRLRGCACVGGAQELHLALQKQPRSSRSHCALVS